MKLMKRFFPVLLIAVFLFSACSQGPDYSQVLESITEQSLMTHIMALSADSMMGRAPGTEGEQKTVDYLIREYRKYGLEPGMPDGSFIQHVPVIGQVTDRDAQLHIRRNGRNLHSFDYYTEMMAWPASQQKRVDVRDAELVYVGYGIIAPEQNWDDYKGIDVSGKILVFKNSDPSTYPDRFAGEARLYYGRWGYKFEMAERMGAVGAIIIHTTPTAGYGWNVVSGSWGRERFELVRDGEPGTTEFSAWLTEEGSTAMFAEAGLDLTEMLEAAENQDFTPVPLEGITASIRLNSTYQELTLMNVVGKIEGNDPDLKNDYIVFTAHHDHLGVGTPVNGDSIYNGALDNASGVSAVLNLARTYSEVRDDLRRSMLFVMVGGEESGLLGSDYFTSNPPVHTSRMTANINIDGLNIFGPTKDIIVVGKGRSSMDDIMQKEAAKDGREVRPDQNPEQGFYYRSDHFSFAKVGVPALYPNAGVRYLNKPDNYFEDVVQPHLSRIYHTVHDKVDENWDLSGAVKDVRLIFRVGKRIANQNDMVTWTPGDEFEAIRKQSLQEGGR
ncbi:MAG: M28 family peptidase [Balneolaceae bacterium]|nr:MAG: M28 family peptidase [Balneolaceae bacterium]